MSQGEEMKPILRRRFAMRGESTLAPLGIALAGILAVATGASAWWSLRTQNEALSANRVEQTLASGLLLSRAAEVMLGANELSALRRLVLDAAEAHDFSTCSITLPDGQVLADAEPGRITLTELPAPWEGGGRPADWSDAPVETIDPYGISVTYPIWVPAYGPATLKITMETPDGVDARWQVQAGVGAIGVASLASLLLVYRQLRLRVQAMELIGDALMALERGESDETALTLSEKFGPHARAFNRLLADRQTMRDQAALRRAEESLGSKERGSGDLVSMCDALQQGLLMVDHEGHVRYANGAAAVFLRAKRDEILGADAAQVLKQPPLLDAIQNAITGPTRRRQTVELDQGGESGSGLLRYSFRPIRRDEKPACLIVIEDVTQQRVAEEARNAFVAHATHELRMPLTNIRLYLETALEDGERDPKLRGECLNVINQETKRLERLVGDMLSMTEIEAGSMKIEKDDVRLDAMFESVEADYQAQAREKRITLTFNLPPKLPVIQGDRDKLVMALHNLVGNALKYTPEGGTVTVDVEEEDGNIVIAVKDTGIGISEEDQDKIFEKFYRARDARVTEITGSGLGLALAREVVRMHGGDITVESEINKGSVFTMTVPMDVA